MPFSVIVRCGSTKPRLLPQLTRLYASSTNLCDSEAEEHLSGENAAFYTFCHLCAVSLQLSAM